jgi:hypothetical protein
MTDLAGDSEKPLSLGWYEHPGATYQQPQALSLPPPPKKGSSKGELSKSHARNKRLEAFLRAQALDPERGAADPLTESRKDRKVLKKKKSKSKKSVEDSSSPLILKYWNEGESTPSNMRTQKNNKEAKADRLEAKKSSPSMASRSEFTQQDGASGEEELPELEMNRKEKRLQKEREKADYRRQVIHQRNSLATLQYYVAQRKKKEEDAVKNVAKDMKKREAARKSISVQDEVKRAASRLREHEKQKYEDFQNAHRRKKLDFSEDDYERILEDSRMKALERLRIQEKRSRSKMMNSLYEIVRYDSEDLDREKLDVLAPLMLQKLPRSQSSMESSINNKRDWGRVLKLLHDR